LHTISNAALSVVGLYQFGLLRSVPEPPLPGLGADAVARPHAGQCAGDRERRRDAGARRDGRPKRANEHPLIPLALFAKTLLDAVNGGYLTAEQFKHKKSAATAPSAPSP
jgi:hypothetical protein